MCRFGVWACTRVRACVRACVRLSLSVCARAFLRLCVAFVCVCVCECECECVGVCVGVCVCTRARVWQLLIVEGRAAGGYPSSVRYCLSRVRVLIKLV